MLVVEYTEDGSPCLYLIDGVLGGIEDYQGEVVHRNFGYPKTNLHEDLMAVLNISRFLENKISIIPNGPRQISYLVQQGLLDETTRPTTSEVLRDIKIYLIIYKIECLLATPE